MITKFPYSHRRTVVTVTFIRSAFTDSGDHLHKKRALRGQNVDNRVLVLIGQRLGQSKPVRYSDTSANEDNSFRNHIR